jgi:plastocyanin
MTRRSLPPVLGLILVLVGAGVYSSASGDPAAGDVTVIQLNKKFDQDTLTIKKGQTVTFVNKDPFTHNVYSESPGVSFDLKTQPPGKSSDVTFSTTGEALVECAIHPSMKMKIIVTDSGH